VAPFGNRGGFLLAAVVVSGGCTGALLQGLGYLFPKLPAFYKEREVRFFKVLGLDASGEAMLGQASICEIN